MAESKATRVGKAPSVPAESVVTVVPCPGEPVAAVFRRLADELAAGAGVPTALMLYGAIAAHAEITRAMRDALGETNWPVTWIEGASCDGAPLAGVQVFTVRDRPVTRVRLGGRVVASVFEDAGAQHCLVGGVSPVAVTLPPPAQTQQAFSHLETALDMAGFTLADVVRTWFYNDDILGWYADFNRVRSAHYAGVKWRTGSLPASTGSGARTPSGAARVVGARALRPAGGAAPAVEVGSPLQCPAPAYGSAFARAMELSTTGGRLLMVSGTASIHPDGRTAWVGDAAKQVGLTMEVIGAILQSRGMDYDDVTRATAYYRDAADKKHFDRWLAEHGRQAMPVVHTHSVVCRDDLLFEVELDAVVTG
ncbi:MAG: RidA family protein [Lacunisphaera sp.]|nr:RidA family protein [Lacunisphaera sp.]